MQDTMQENAQAAPAASYNPMEMMICTAARYLQNGNIAAIGTGAPCAAAMLAQKTHAPDLTVMFESGGIAPILPMMPVSIADSSTYYKGLMAAGVGETMDTCARGQVDYTFIGGAQIDKYGNLNTTCIGDHSAPKVRFPGSGGANDFGAFCWRTMIMTPHVKERFVERVEFITTPGYLDGPGAREAAGLPPGGGPHKIITNLAILGFDEESKIIKIEALGPGVTVEQVLANTGFAPVVPDRIDTIDPPTDRELKVLREEVDPDGFLIGRA